MIAHEADAWREQARRSDHVFATGEALHILRSEVEQLRRWGFDSFEQWVETDLGFGKRMAQDYIAIWLWIRRIDPEGGHHAALNALPVTKLRLAARAGFTIEDVASLPKRVTEVRRKALEGGKPRSHSGHLQFVHEPECTELVEAGLARAAQLSGSSSRSHNLAVICQDFLATNRFGKSDDPQELERHIARLEIALGLHIVAFKPNWELVAGAHHIDALFAAVSARGDADQAAPTLTRFSAGCVDNELPGSQRGEGEQQQHSDPGVDANVCNRCPA